MGRRKGLGVPVVIAVGFGALAGAWTFPLASHLSTHLLGPAAGDNVEFLWNFWWMRTALASGLDFFRTPFLFAPLGADLTLHTHTALPAFVGATALRSVSIITALKATILAALFLNGFCAYLLARRVVPGRGSAVVAGLVFAGSPYLSAHLNGHFNLVHAWVIPLFALAASEMLRGSVRWGLLCGVVIASTLYIDYYYYVYESAIGIVLCALFAWRWSLRFGEPNRLTRWLLWVLAAAILLDGVIIVAIVWTKGFSIPLGRRQISMHGVYNGFQLLWILVGAWLFARRLPYLEVRRREDWAAAPALRATLTGIGVFLLGAAPLLAKGLELVRRGEYVTQHYLWRSAPAGIDLGTIVLGNPFHGLYGSWTRDWYARLGIDVIENGAWLGIAPIALSVWAIRASWSNPEVRRWTVIGSVFLIWALGPHLTVFGRTTALILPETLVRYMPLVSNARIPGRAMVVVSLAAGLLTAAALSRWREQSKWPTALLAAVALAVMADYVPAPFPLVRMDRLALYDILRARPEPGAVCELPLGLADGFGQVGRFDSRTMFYQTIHARPMVGGFLARLPPSVTSAYMANPLMAGLLRLSSEAADPGTDHPLPGRAEATEILRRDKIRFFILDREAASSALIDYVEHVLPLDLVAQDGKRSLYVATQ